LLIRALVLISPFALSAAWLVDRWLGERAHGTPTPIRTFVVVAAPVDHVWTVLSDIERQPEWMHDLKSVRLTTPAPVGVGTRGVGRVRVFGIPVEDPVEVTAFEPPTHFAIRHDGFFTGSGDIRLAGRPDRTTTVTWEETLVPPILPDLGRHLLAIVFRPVFRRDLERLAAIAEAG
jgi:uncharacterized membrane protein